MIVLGENDCLNDLHVKFITICNKKEMKNGQPVRQAKLEIAAIIILIKPLASSKF